MWYRGPPQAPEANVGFLSLLLLLCIYVHCTVCVSLYRCFVALSLVDVAWLSLPPHNATVRQPRLTLPGLACMLSYLLPRCIRSGFVKCYDV